MENDLGFSIVVCTYNGQTRLQPTLTHLAFLKIPASCRVELIVVDNASTDNTAKFVKETWLALGAPFLLKLICENRAGKGFAIETGYDAASFSYIITVDDDNWLANDYLFNALSIFQIDSSIGILQAKSIAAFETTPPGWLEELKTFFVLGSPVEEPGFFPKNNFFVWGAGMVIKKTDWKYIRNLGFAFLSSKLAGKAAGEDNETAIALLMLGRKIFYSDTLSYQHFMPAERLKWTTLKNNFETVSHAGYYFFLYAMALDSYYRGYMLNSGIVKRSFRKVWLARMRSFTLKQHIAYLLLPREEYYQLKIGQYFSLYKWFNKLSKNAMQDIAFLQAWMRPILEEKPGNFKMPVQVW